MREPQVVRTPSVQKMSLWIIGMPVSGPACPPASRWSATAAAANAHSAVMLIRALSCGCARSVRASASRVSSTAEYLRAASPAASSASVRAITQSLRQSRAWRLPVAPSFDHTWNEIQTRLYLRRIALIGLARVAGGDGVCAQPLDLPGQRVRHGLDPGGLSL